MDLASLLQWWDEWQLSVLVLGSLGVKCFLAVAAGARKSHIGAVYRFFIWLSYLGGDSLAIYALAALLNFQKKGAQEQGQSPESRALQLLWAPVMLMHLGGLTNISAYNIEDNELWRRHIATSVSQVAVALYVFCKLWSSTSDKRLLAAAILLFIPGVSKCFEKPLALRRSSFHNLVSQPATTNTNENQLRRKKSASITKDRAQHLSLEGFITKAKKAASDAGQGFIHNLESDEGFKCLKRLSRPDKLFVDLARPYSERARATKSFWKLQSSRGTDQKVIGIGISNTFNLLYTKDFTLPKKGRDEHLVDLMCSLSTWVLCLLVPIPAIGLLHSSVHLRSGHDQAYRSSDVIITFVLLYVTLLVDACSIFSLANVPPWHGMVAQHNLMALFAQNRRHRPAWLARAAELLRCTELLDHLFFHIEPCHSSQQGITSAVRSHVQDGWEKHIEDAETYTGFSDMRGQWTLGHEQCVEGLGGSLALDRPFDEAVLVWHLATDLCKSALRRNNSKIESDATLATHISNYMIHLLFSNPEMLMPGSRKELCTLAYKQMEAIFVASIQQEGQENKAQTDKKKKNEQENAAAADDVADRLLDHAFGSPQDEGFLYAAWKLAHALDRLGDKKKEWRIIRGVWVEMLCFSAIRCRGYLHAKSLGSGGEYLTFVWLLMAHAGLETFPERQQRPRPMPETRDQTAAPAAAQSSAPNQNNPELI